MIKKYSALLGIMCLSIGVTLFLNLFLPELVWKIIIASLLIICGGLLIYK